MSRQRPADSTRSGRAVYIPQRVIDRFLDNRAVAVFKSKYVDSPCDLWMGGLRGDGLLYGQLDWRDNRGLKRNISAHVLSFRHFKLAGKPLRSGQINHLCDTRLCVNPTHLYKGSASANMEDYLDRGPSKEDHRAFAVRHALIQMRELRAEYAEVVGSLVEFSGGAFTPQREGLVPPAVWAAFDG